MNMKTYYCVRTRYYDDERVSAQVVKEMESPILPETIIEEGTEFDTYYDWFESYDEARAYAVGIRIGWD